MATYRLFLLFPVFWWLIVLISFWFQFIIIFIILIAHFPQRFSMVRTTLLNLLFSTCQIVGSSWWNLWIPFVLILTDNGDWRLWCLWNWFYFSFANPFANHDFLRDFKFIWPSYFSSNLQLFYQSGSVQN